MKTPFTLATLMVFGGPLPIVTCAEVVRAHEVTVYEKMLVPFLNVLASEYVGANESRKIQIEYSAYLANRTYWVNTHKFGHERNSSIEKFLGELNAELLRSVKFSKLFSDWKAHYTEGFPSDSRYFAKLKDGTELEFEIATVEDWNRLHRELFDFVKWTARISNENSGSGTGNIK